MAMNQIQPIPAQPVEARRVGLTVGRLRKLLARLPDDMDVRFWATHYEECHVLFAETYRYHNGGTLLLSDSNTQGARATVIFDATEE
jgi:hypothetical protein